MALWETTPAAAYLGHYIPRLVLAHMRNIGLSACTKGIAALFRNLSDPSRNCVDAAVSAVLSHCKAYWNCAKPQAFS
jgi:hypothetical protein